MADASVFFKIPKSVRKVLDKHDRPRPVWYSGALHAENGHDVDLVPTPGMTPEKAKHLPDPAREIRRPQGGLDDALSRKD